MRALGLALLLICTCGPATGGERIVVGSKNFAENRLLAEMFARLLEARTELTVERRLNLAGTHVCFEALRSGSIDLYPEYTGTGLVTLLGESPRGDARETLNRVRGEFLGRFDLRWLPPLGFENSYELAVPSELAANRVGSVMAKAKLAAAPVAGGGTKKLPPATPARSKPAVCTALKALARSAASVSR